MEAEALWREESRPCPLCRSEQRKSLGKRGGAAHHLGRGRETEIVRCKSCDAIYAFPMLLPRGNPYDDFGADEYFRAHDPTVKRQAGVRLARYAGGLLGRQARLLELGCGRGELLYGAKQEGWQVRGVEMTHEYAELGRADGVDIEEARIEDCRSLDESWDVILMAAVLEHLYDPMAVLPRVYQALRPGGLFYVDVPNEGSLAIKVGTLYQRLQRRNWSLNLSPTFPPFHVVGFSPRSLRFALQGLGFEILRLDVVEYANEVPRNSTIKRKIERAAFSLLQQVGKRLRMGDGLVCWARKPASPNDGSAGR